MGVAPIASVQAALLDRGGGLIYDNVLNVTWLQDANYASSTGYDEDGFMTWSNATAWVEQLKYAGYSDWRLPTVSPIDPQAGFNYALSFDASTDYAYGITSPASEMSYMFYVNLGNLAQCTSDSVPYNCQIQPGGGLTNAGPFNNLQHGYWSGTDSEVGEPAGQPSAWYFGMNEGFQGFLSKEGYLARAWAVRSGDVRPRPPWAGHHGNVSPPPPWAGHHGDKFPPPPWAGRPDSTPPIPEPESMALLSVGLGLLGLLRRRQGAASTPAVGA